MIEDCTDNSAFEAGLAAPDDPRWQEFFGWDVTRTDIVDSTPGFDRWYHLAYDLGLVQPYDWLKWCGSAGKPFVESRNLSRASVADAVRIVTAFVRSDRFNDGQLIAELGPGLIPAALHRIWKGHVSADAFLDWSSYSDDIVYRWSYECR